MTILSSINFPSGQFNSTLQGLVDLSVMIIPFLKCSLWYSSNFTFAEV